MVDLSSSFFVCLPGRVNPIQTTIFLVKPHFLPSFFTTIKPAFSYGFPPLNQDKTSN
jgi:hypothetical protein